MIKYLRWLAIVGLSLGLGVLTVQYLTVHPLSMSWYLLALCTVLFALIVVLAVGFRRKALLVAIPLALVLFAAGYLVATRSFLAREIRGPSPN